ncbi:MAG: 6-phosphogluconolactonase [Actinobacteria bacterium]|nr:6-phosphogluconolactonase [Actinomycetota bacterium]
MGSPLRRPPRLEIFEDPEAMARHAAELFRELSPKKVVLTGGQTPKRSYELISQLDMRWDEIDLFLSDERFVPLHDDRSNEKMVREALGGRANEARLHGFSRGAGPEESAEMYGQEVTDYLPFDFTFMGLGEDGHTASLFPSDPHHDRRDVMAFAYRPDLQGPWRTTLSVAALDRSSVMVFLVAGQEKADALRVLMEGGDIPAAKVHPEGNLLILSDRAAASRVSRRPNG